MAQEFHNHPYIRGEPRARLRLISDVTGPGQPANWDWVRITVNNEASKGDDAGESKLDKDAGLAAAGFVLHHRAPRWDGTGVIQGRGTALGGRPPTEDSAHRQALPSPVADRLIFVRGGRMPAATRTKRN
jgi:hypothetical protein